MPGNTSAKSCYQGFVCVFLCGSFRKGVRETAQECRNSRKRHMTSNRDGIPVAACWRRKITVLIHCMEAEYA